MQSIDVAIPNRSYSILIEKGLLYCLGKDIKQSLSSYCRKIVIVSNKPIFSLYGDILSKSLIDEGFQLYHFLIGDGEKYKTLATAEKLFAFLIENRVERRDCLVALGGGVVGDLTGFVAATYLRGIDYVQVPTSLLAQIDAAIGGKTAVNHPKGKNLIGAFHQPKLVVIDPNVLTTLPKRELKAAMQEVIKYGVIADKKLFELVEKKKKLILAGDVEVLSQIIFSCCVIKAGVVSRDEHESGERRILNFGHTFGHALETATNYKRFKHGEAVGYGIIAATHIANKLGIISEKETIEIENLVYAYGQLPTIQDLNINLLLDIMQQDKKSLAGQLTFVLPEQIGRVIIKTSVPLSVIHQVLGKLISGY
jgi:3-dehydroquinate synthase